MEDNTVKALMLIKLVLSQIAIECLDIESSEVCRSAEARKTFQKDQDSLIEQSNTLIEQSSHVTEKMRTIQVFIPRKLTCLWHDAANASTKPNLCHNYAINFYE